MAEELRNGLLPFLRNLSGRTHCSLPDGMSGLELWSTGNL